MSPSSTDNINDVLIQDNEHTTEEKVENEVGEGGENHNEEEDDGDKDNDKGEEEKVEGGGGGHLPPLPGRLRMTWFKQVVVLI